MEEKTNIELTENSEEIVEIEGENIEFAVVEDENAVHVMPIVDGEIVNTPVVNVEVFSEEETPTENPEVEKEPVVDEFKPAPVYTGVVAGCKQLNVRENPNKDAKVVCVIPEGKELTFKPADNDFYKVYFELNETLYTGYCMQKFINHK